MKLKTTFLSLLTILLLSGFRPHAVNMSVGDVTFAPNKVTIKFKFFVDNLQNTLTKQGGKFVDFEEDGYISTTEQCLQKYLATRFTVSVNNSPCKLVYKTGMLNKDILLVQYEASLRPGKVKSIKIKNTILFDDNLPEMKNIMNINLANKIKVMEFDYNEAYRTGVYTQEVRY